MFSEEVAIRVENVSKCYQLYDSPRDRLKQFILPRFQRWVGNSPKDYCREFQALTDISFEVKKGETVGVIGRNGSGKSTLLQLICGTLTPSTGAIQINGRVAALLELGAGFTPDFTGRENVYINATILGLSSDQVDQRFERIAAFADIGDFIDQPVKTYSSGMYVRLAFAVIANVDADVLIIDEALAVGDVFFTQKCMRFLRGFMRTGTVLFVSHDTAAVTNLCQTAIWLERGQMRLTGPSKAVTEAYLAAFYEEKHGTSTHTRLKREFADTATIPRKDGRLDVINATPFRNDIELFDFDPDAPSFGKGGAGILNVQLLDEGGQPVAWIVGGEVVTVSIRACAAEHIVGAIIGFMVKDRLGQTLFSDNTYLTYADNPISIPAGKEFEARFVFRMPILPAGDYSIAAAIAEGTQSDHVQHHWIHDAIVFKSHSSSVCTGLVGVPMADISIGVIP